jgi:hypothetical protein
MRVIVLLLAMLSGVPIHARAQARSFQELDTAVTRGSQLTVTDASGREVTGTLSDLTSSILTIRSNGRPVAFRESEVVRIRQRRTDSLLNGAVIGAVSGIVPILVIVLAERAGGEPCTGQCTGAFLFWGAVGAGSGLAVDAVIRENRTVYVGRTANSVSRILTVSPLVRRGSAGVRLTMDLGGRSVH